MDGDSLSLSGAPVTLTVSGYQGERLIFSNSTALDVSRLGDVSTSVRTDRARYRPGETVRIRIASLHLDNRPYKGPVGIGVSVGGVLSSSSACRGGKKHTTTAKMMRKTRPDLTRPTQGRPKSFRGPKQNLIQTFGAPLPPPQSQGVYALGVYAHDSNADTRDTAVVGRYIDQKYFVSFFLRTYFDVEINMMFLIGKNSLMPRAGPDDRIIVYKCVLHQHLDI